MDDIAARLKVIRGMSKAVLLDLDDTLLTYPQGTMAFVGQYIDQLSELFAQRCGVTDIREVLIRATRRVTANTDPLQLNQEVYMRYLSELLPADDLRAVMDEFLDTIYPGLQAMTEPVQAAVPLVQNLFARGYQVVIATNPLYPWKAVEQRLQWAGFDTRNGMFARVTHAENSHFAKPQPHYYEEILTVIGCEPHEAIMIGDNWKNDILPAMQTGMATFWLRNRHNAGQDYSGADCMGTLEDFAYCVERGWLEELPGRDTLPAQLFPRLTAGAAALMGTIQNMPTRFWMQRPDPAEWSPLEVVVHLMEFETEVVQPALEKIAREDNPFIRSPRPPQPGERDLTGVDGWETAYQFAAARARTVDMLESFPADAWGRPARHSIYGPTTLQEMVVLTARHDQLHIQQLGQTIEGCV